MQFLCCLTRVKNYKIENVTTPSKSWQKKWRHTQNFIKICIAT
jgi:hypothetical protein